MSALATELVRPMVVRRPSSRQAGGQPVGIRLTRRGRLVVGALATVVALLGVFASQQAVAGQPGGAVAVASRTVDAGETLWDIASGLAAPGQDVREVVATLVDLNGLSDAGLRAGQELLVPVP